MNAFHFDIVTFSIAIASLFLLYRYREKGILLSFMAVCFPFLLSTANFAFSPVLWPSRDSYDALYPMFEYIADYWSQGHLMPEWFAANGGTRFGLYHMICSTLAPHRIFGYSLYSLLPASALVAYKLQTAAGVLLMGFGWWMLLRRLHFSRPAAFFSTTAVIMGGPGVFSFINETFITQTYLLPWFALSVISMEDDPLFIYPAAVLLGFALSSVYPQLYLINTALILSTLILYRFLNDPPKTAVDLFRENWKRLRIHTLGASLLFLLSVLPAFYLLQNLGNLSSPLRPPTYDTLEQYMSRQGKDPMSATSICFSQYFLPEFRQERHPVTERADECAFFVGRIILLLAVIGVLFRFKHSWPVALLMLITAALTAGLNFAVPIPKYLYLLHFPFIKNFHQWFHFNSMLSMTIILLATMGFQHLEQWLSRAENSKWAKGNLLILSILFLHLADLTAYDRGFLNYVQHDQPRADKEQYGLFLKHGVMQRRVFEYTNRYQLNTVFPQLIPENFFLTTNILSVQGGVDQEFVKCGEIASGRNPAFTVSNIPQSMVPPPSVQQPKLEMSGTLTFNGLLLNVYVPEPALLVTPINYDLGVQAYIDGVPDPVWRVNSALCGTWVNQGTHSVRFEIKRDSYHVIAVSTVCLIVFVAFFLYWLLKKETLIQQR